MNTQAYEQSVFISCAWGGESEEIVNQIDQDLQQRGLKMIRDKRDLCCYKHKAKLIKKRHAKKISQYQTVAEIVCDVA